MSSEKEVAVMRRTVAATLLTCLVVLAAYYGIFVMNRPASEENIKVGFLFENDESTPYTYNFMLARDALQRRYPDRVEVYTRSNILPEETEEPLRDLIHKGCRIIFCNNYSEQLVSLAGEYPDVTFCQVSFPHSEGTVFPSNYHMFNGAVYQARYISGVIAGMKLQQLIDNRYIRPENALVGYIGGFETPEVISGYTAFFLGIRSVVPEATMKVRYIHAWNNFALEKQTARELIDEGCMVLSHHTDTIGPAIACEEADRPVFFVGYNRSMMDVAPDSTLISLRVNYTPYVIGSVEAVMENRRIEKNVSATAFGNDCVAGFESDWVQLLEPNTALLAPGSREKIDELIAAFRKGSLPVFQGPYTGTDPQNPSNTIDLSTVYKENSTSSSPSFHYILDEGIFVE
ncbi:MAG: BMP family ABC transporter substrate-binding protein [Oscillospiraceae bacterium]|nr:BMP family ABC transporter substrate-binding protein [Oscillospiraceae bacterium]